MTTHSAAVGDASGSASRPLTARRGLPISLCVTRYAAADAVRVPEKAGQRIWPETMTGSYGVAFSTLMLAKMRTVLPGDNS